jgi:hypothetical protein
LIIFKSLFLFVVLQAELPVDGWVAVERHEKEASPEGADETDPSIWVVFSKKIGSEKILVRFPVEPAYKYLKEDGSEMEISASAEGSEHLALVLSPSNDLLKTRKTSLQGAIIILERMSEEGEEIVYWKDGYWFKEKLVSTEEHSYILQTKSADLDSDSHRIFASSLDIEKK